MLLDTESGFKEVVVINASYGLGETIVQGLVVPDEYVVFKPTLAEGFAPILKKEIWSKKIKTVYRAKGTEQVAVPTAQQLPQQCITDQEILEISKAVCTIEDLYSVEKDSWCPMDVEWAKDGIDNLIYIVQARPETIQCHHTNEYIQYRLSSEQAPVVLLRSVLANRLLVVGLSGE